VTLVVDGTAPSGETAALISRNDDPSYTLTVRLFPSFLFLSLPPSCRYLLCPITFPCAVMKLIFDISRAPRFPVTFSPCTEKLLPVSRRRRGLPPEGLESTEKPIRRWKYSRLRNNSGTAARALVRFPQIDGLLCLHRSLFFYFFYFSFPQNRGASSRI